MPKQVKQRRSADENEVAFQLVQRSTQEPESQPPPSIPSISEYFRQIGRKGGKIGGKRRLKTMTAEERSQIAKKAAKARWKKNKGKR